MARADPEIHAPSRQLSTVWLVLVLWLMLAGQGWFDLSQYRIGPPGGVQMHWSRLGDLMPAAVILLTEPWLGHAGADFAAQIATPLLWLLPMVWLCLGIGRNLAGQAADLPCAVLLLMSQGMMTLFGAGNIDHHTLQLLTLLLLLWATTGARTARTGAIAAAAVCLSLCIGIENAPHIVAVMCGLGLLWLRQPAAEAAFVQGFGRALLLGSGVCALLLMPRPWPTQCDSWTQPVFWLCAGTGLLLWATRLLPHAALGSDRWSIAKRAGALLLPAVVLMVAVAAAYPACRLHPAGNDPLLWTYWMDSISENRSTFTVMKEQGFFKGYVFIAAAPACIVAALWLIVQAPAKSDRWLAPVAACSAALLLTLLHARAQAMLSATSLVLGAGLIARWRQSPDLRRLLGWLLFMPYTYYILCFFLGQTVKQELGFTANPNRCRTPQVLAALQQRPPATLILPLMAEPPILQATSHRVLAATYHRNVAGNHAMLAAMIATPDAARQLLRQNQVKYILYCPGYSIDQISRDAPASLARHLVDRTPPRWLKSEAVFAGRTALYRITD